MRMKITYIALLISAIMLIGTASARLGVPNQFYGSVTMDGSPAPDGTRVSALIGGDTYATMTADGRYSLIVRDPNNNRKGDIVEFYVSYVKVAEHKFYNGNVTELNIVFTSTCGDGECTGSESCSSCPQDCGSCPPSDSGTTGSSTSSGTTGESYNPPCYENWTCTSWSPPECPESEIQTRTCIDANNCGTEKEKPAEEKVCTYTPSQVPSVCTAGDKACSGDNLLECGAEGDQWIILKTCKYGCSPTTLECNPASVTGSGEGSPAGEGLTGLFVQNPASSIAILAFVLAIVAGLIYWKRL